MIASKPLPLLYLEWLDAGTITNGEWLTKEECLEDANSDRFLNRTVDWLLREDDTALVLSAQLAPGTSGKDMFDLVMFIPKVLIRKRKCLKT